MYSYTAPKTRLGTKRIATVVSRAERPPVSAITWMVAKMAAESTIDGAAGSDSRSRPWTTPR